MCIRDRKWYYRFYVEDASGNLVPKEYAGTESKSETEKLLRQAMDYYESKKFIAKSENITVGELLDIWAEEELKTGTLSNGCLLYTSCIKFEIQLALNLWLLLCAEPCDYEGRFLYL